VYQGALYALKRQLRLRTTLISYDVIPILFPHLVVLPPGGFAAYFVDMAWCAEAVLCISEHTRRDCEAVLRRLGAPVPPTHVIVLGSELRTESSGTPPAALLKAGAQRPFVLFVSTIERRKNHEILYRAWLRLREQGVQPHRLVFVGMKGWGVNDLFSDLELDPRIQDDILVLNHVPDAELAWLYQHAAFTVFPSLYEGWGLPVVESLAWGKFCLASNAASLPEAGGEWAEYLDPWDLPAWVERLGFYMTHPEEVARRNARIAQEFQPPTWDGTAEQIHRVAMTAGDST
jgi:glycosyltransferase involved in cell wall biosynthesis